MEKHEEVVNVLTTTLRGKPLTLSMDCEVRKGRKIFSLNCHLIVDGELKTMHLEMIEIKEICTGGLQ